MQLWALICDTFRETRDKKLFWIMLFVSTLAALGLACIGFDENGWSLFFGAVRYADPVYVKDSPAAEAIMGAFVSKFLVGTYIGWLGTVAALVATAGIIPAFLQKGNIDVVLAKPMSRTVIFLGKYLGSLSFVLFQTTYFVLLTFVILRVQIGKWQWGYWWTVPLMVALFSFLYCVSALVAVWGRSALMSLIVTLLYWAAIPGVGLLDATLSGRVSLTGEVTVPKQFDQMSPAAKLMHMTHRILPKTSDIPVIVGNQIDAAPATTIMNVVSPGAEQALTEGDLAAMEREEKRQEQTSALYVVGTSLAFEAGVLLIACILFCRADF